MSSLENGLLLQMGWLELQALELEFVLDELECRIVLCFHRHSADFQGDRGDSQSDSGDLKVVLVGE